MKMLTEEQKAKRKAAGDRYRERNKELCKQRSLSSYFKHKEKHQKRAAKWYLENRDRSLAYGKKWQRANREACRLRAKKDYESGAAEERRFRLYAKDRRHQLFLSAKTRAKKRGWEFTITIDDIVLQDVCPLLGIPINYQPRGKALPDSASLDRIDCSRGYVPGNVMVISWRANRLKCDATVEELEMLVTNLKLMSSHQVLVH
jgi:hypothetical protein